MNAKFLLKSFWFMFLITFLTINWSITIWFERNFCLFSTICTSYLVHFSRTSIESSFSIFSIHIYFFPFFYYGNVTLIFKDILINKILLSRNIFHKSLKNSIFSI